MLGDEWWVTLIPEGRRSGIGNSPLSKTAAGNGKGPCTFTHRPYVCPWGPVQKKWNASSTSSSPSFRWDSCCATWPCVVTELPKELQWHQPQLKKPGGLVKELDTWTSGISPWRQETVSKPRSFFSVVYGREEEPESEGGECCLWVYILGELSMAKISFVGGWAVCGHQPGSSWIRKAAP